MARNFVVVASAARTTTGTSGTLDAPEGFDLVLSASVTAASGTTPTLDLSVEWSSDGGTTWYTADPVDTFTQITAASARVKRFTAKGTEYRIRWTIGGTTPSFTFAVTESTF
jgi:hypothetical protein